MHTSPNVLEEYTKCLLNTEYAIETYLETMSKAGMVQFQLFPKQKEIVQKLQDCKYNIVAKPRQAGVSTTTAAVAAITAAFADYRKPEAILILANKQDLAQEFLAKIKDFVQQLPRWVWGEEYYGSKEREEKDIFIKKSAKEVKLPNGSRIRALATSKDALRGFAPSWLIMDEAAFIEQGAEVFGAAMTSLGASGGRCTLISTPNGMDALYHKTYSQAQKKKNGFNIIEMRWYEDPRNNYDLEWIQEDEKTGEKTIEPETEFTQESYAKRIKEKWSPTSTWYRDMCGLMNHDARMIAQELDVSFLGSGGNVIHDKYVEMHNTENVCEPEYISGPDNEIWVWKQPIPGHEYIMGVDVARGDGEDASTIVVIDVTEMEQVMEYEGKMPPDIFAYTVQEYGDLYQAHTVVDVTGGMGVSTVLKLIELDYKRLHYDTPRSKVLTAKGKLDAYQRDDAKMPGFNVGSARIPMIAHLEKMVRTNAVKIRSRRLTEEMKTFVYKNGRPDHMRGYHDDLLMALAMGLWVYQSSFKELEKVNNKTKAMLDSWLCNTPNNPNGTHQKEATKRQPNFSPLVAKNMQDPQGTYGWLFK
jgi:phage FluMu gp28-like protein